MADNKGFMGRGFSFPFRVDPSTNRIAMSSAGQDVRILLQDGELEARVTAVHPHDGQGGDHA